MLQVKSGFFGRTLTEERVVRVARGGLEKAVDGAEDTSTYQGPIDQLQDWLCDQVKKKTIEHISSLGCHTGSLHKELEKPLAQRNPEIISTEIAQIDQAREGITRFAKWNQSAKVLLIW